MIRAPMTSTRRGPRAATGSSRLIASTGIDGLDDILVGGFTRRRLFLVEGMPGSGKTTLALQFLLAGVRRGETVLYVTLSETEEELRAVAQSHGWTLDGIEIRELTPPEGALDIDEQNTMFHPSEIELASTTKRILDDVERLKPTCIIFDSLSELRLLAGTALRYRRQILALKQFFSTRDCTVILLDDMTATEHDLQVQSIAHGAVLLEEVNSEYGSARRRLRVVKYRGVHFRGAIPRLCHPAGRARGLSPARGIGAPADCQPGKAPERRGGVRWLVGRRHRRRHQHAHRGRRRDREIDAGRPTRVRCSRAWAALRGLRVR
jgi:KaiC/GvpD/RAD55 family RecA-like ATPase